MHVLTVSRVTTALACTGLLVLGADYASMATTGQSLLLGKTNAAGATTKVSNTGSGPAMNLGVRSVVTPPFSTNGRGKVANLYADRAASADNAGKLGGRTLAQVRAGVNASELGGLTADEVANLGMTWGTVSGADNTYSAPSDVEVTHAGTGLYCIYVSGIPASGGRIVATPDYATDDTHVGEAETQTFVEVDDSASDCSTGGFEVVAFNSDPASPYYGTEQQTYFADTGFVFTVVGFPSNSGARQASAPQPRLIPSITSTRSSAKRG